MLSCYVAVLNALLLRCSASMRGPSTHTGLLCVRRRCFSHLHHRAAGNDPLPAQQPATHAE
jgi:hypothetical protein